MLRLVPSKRQYEVIRGSVGAFRSQAHCQSKKVLSHAMYMLDDVKAELIMLMEYFA